MGAVFLLVLLPVIGAVCFMLKTMEGAGALLGGAVVLLLGIAFTVGILRLAHSWDEEGAKH